MFRLAHWELKIELLSMIKKYARATSDMPDQGDALLSRESGSCRQGNKDEE